MEQECDHQARILSESELTDQPLALPDGVLAKDRRRGVDPRRPLSLPGQDVEPATPRGRCMSWPHLPNDQIREGKLGPHRLGGQLNVSHTARASILLLPLTAALGSA
jgi:hypothetical protein